MVHKKRIRELLEIDVNHSKELQVQIQGWIRTRRDSKGGFSFLEVNDGSSLSNIQVIADQNLDNYDSDIKRLYVGCSVDVCGFLKSSQGGKQKVEIQASSVQEVGFCDPEKYVLGKQRVSFDVLRSIPHLRPRTNTFGAVTRVRNRLAMAVHRFFQEKKFMYVNTPIITSSDCEGAGEMFQVTTLSLGKKDYSQDFFQKPAYLTVSGQLELESYACSMGRVYTFGPTFRAENSHTSRHLSEFWMVEPEVAFADLDANMDLAEEFLKFCLQDILKYCEDDMAFFDQRIEKGLLQKLRAVVETPFVRITYTEAIKILEKAVMKGNVFEYAVEWGIDLQSEHERYLTEKHFKGPVIVTDYPVGIKAFYMKLNQDGKTVRGMDVLVPQIGELIGGAQREDNLDALEKRMGTAGINPEHLSWYSDLRRYGSVPHSGFGLGFERLVQFSTGMSNIRDVIPFPRTSGSL
jgi:asparaginyl-tRNA synthetase